MKGKVLILASVASMIEQFNIPNIKLLLELEYEVHVACNFEKGNTCSDIKIEELKKLLKDLNVLIYQIDFTRSVFDFKEDIRAYRQVKEIMIINHYSFIHCHSPIGGVIGRLVCKATKTKCIYTAHGFHFFKGAPLKNWILFYPIEKWLSKYTDVLITINHEDYILANNKFHSKSVSYIPSVGINTEKFNLSHLQREIKRKEMRIDKNDFVLLSIGELAERKNHEIIIRALLQLKNKRIIYFIAGEGKLREKYQEIINNSNMNDNIKLLGIRNDIPELCNMADVIVHPSKREGFGIAAVEGMAAGLPLICSYVNGIKDYAKHMENAICCRNDDLNDFVNAIDLLYKDRTLRVKLGKNAKKETEKYDINITKRITENIYKSFLNE